MIPEHARWTDGAVVAFSVILWVVWQLLMAAAVFAASCTKSGCGGPEYVSISAKSQGVVTVITLALLGPLILRAARRITRDQRGARLSATAFVLGVAAIAAGWLFEINRALGCCGYDRNFLPDGAVVPLWMGSALLGTVAVVLLAAAYAMADVKAPPKAAPGDRSDVAS